MCDTRRSPVRFRPAWSCLYAIPPLVVAALLLVEFSVKVPALRLMLLGAVLVLAWGALAGWVRVNRVALDLSEWCDGASTTVRVRMITSRPLPGGGPSSTDTAAVAAAGRAGAANRVEEVPVAAPP